jgi:hypothetical protein
MTRIVKRIPSASVDQKALKHKAFDDPGHTHLRALLGSPKQTVSAVRQTASAPPRQSDLVVAPPARTENQQLAG